MDNWPRRGLANWLQAKCIEFFRLIQHCRPAMAEVNPRKMRFPKFMANVGSRPRLVTWKIFCCPPIHSAFGAFFGGGYRIAGGPAAGVCGERPLIVSVVLALLAKLQGRFTFHICLHDVKDFGRRSVRSLKGRAGPRVESSAAVPAAIANTPRSWVIRFASDSIARAAPRAMHAFRMNQLE